MTAPGHSFILECTGENMSCYSEWYLKCLCPQFLFHLKFMLRKGHNKNIDIVRYC